VLFDFGGTLDADGLTWKTRFFRLCREEGLVADPERFDPVFHAADDALVGAIPATLPFRDTVHRLAAGVTASEDAVRACATVMPTKNPAPARASAATRPMTICGGRMVNSYSYRSAWMGWSRAARMAG